MSLDERSPNDTSVYRGIGSFSREDSHMSTTSAASFQVGDAYELRNASEGDLVLGDVTWERNELVFEPRGKWKLKDASYQGVFCFKVFWFKDGKCDCVLRGASFTIVPVWRTASIADEPAAVASNSSRNTLSLKRKPASAESGDAAWKENDDDGDMKRTRVIKRPERRPVVMTALAAPATAAASFPRNAMSFVQQQQMHPAYMGALGMPPAHSGFSMVASSPPQPPPPRQGGGSDGGGGMVASSPFMHLVGMPMYLPRMDAYARPQQFLPPLGAGFMQTVPLPQQIQLQQQHQHRQMDMQQQMLHPTRVQHQQQSFLSLDTGRRLPSR